MMFLKSHKVKFQDGQLDDYVLEPPENVIVLNIRLTAAELDLYINTAGRSLNKKCKYEISVQNIECVNSVLKSKLQSKIEALTIMNKELDKCSMERDRYRVLVEQLKCRRKGLCQTQGDYDHLSSLKSSDAIRGGDLLADTTEQNNILKLEVETLRAKLDEALGDNSALRKQLHLWDNCICNKNNKDLSYSNKDFEQLVQELEKTNRKYEQIQLDYRAALDEKDELSADRDYYKSKVQRLNHQISYILSTRLKPQASDENGDPPKPVVDIDALVTENKYLHERITQLQVEKEIVKRNLTKYKTLLENRHKTDPTNLKKGFIDVMTQKQVREFLDINSKTGVKRSSAAELKSLCLGLFEALNDKSIALQHHRKTNRILANRITELEKTLESWCNGQKYIPIFPSQMLLDEFLPESESKSDAKSDEKYITECEDSNSLHIIKTKYPDSDDEGKNSNSSSSENKYNNDDVSDGGRLGAKTVLPFELEELVKEALAEMKPSV